MRSSAVASPPSDSDSESESETESESENEPESESESEPVTSTSSVTTVSAAFSAEAFFAATYRSTFSAHAFLQMSIAPTLLMEASASGCRYIAKSVARRASSASRGAAAQQRCRRWALCSSDEMRVGRSGRNKGHPPWTDGSVDGVAQFSKYGIPHQLSKMAAEHTANYGVHRVVEQPRQDT